MAGVRIQHPTARSGMFTVIHPRRYSHPLMCSRCHKFHENKTYHLDLDDTGSAIVSTTVLNRLKEVGLAGFVIMNEVKNPPPITLNIPGSILNRFKVMQADSRRTNG